MSAMCLRLHWHAIRLRFLCPGLALLWCPRCECFR